MKAKIFLAAALLVAGFSVPSAAASKLNLEALLHKEEVAEAVAVENSIDPHTDLPLLKSRDLKAAADAAVKERNEGTKIIEVPSGLAFVSTGQATYEKKKNINASRLAQREAYLQSFLRARSELSKTLRGMSLEAREYFFSSSEAVVTEEETKKKSANLRVEEFHSTVEATLRNYVVFDVFDDGKGTVSVTVAVSPNTLNMASQISGGVTLMDNLEAGVERMLSEIRKGVAAPAGARIVKTIDGSAAVVVAYGSAIVLQNDDGTVKPQDNLHAKREARRNADVALVAFLQGDKILWETGGMPMKDPEAMKEQLEKEQAVWEQRMAHSEMMSSAIKGKLPAGVSSTSWIDEATGWCYAVCLYQPDFEEAAKKMSLQMSR